MEPSYEKFCLDLNRAPTGKHTILKARIKPKEWTQIPGKSEVTQTIYVKGMRKSDLVYPVISYPDDLDETSIAAQRQWFRDVVKVSGGTNEMVVTANRPTTVPIEVLLFCIR